MATKEKQAGDSASGKKVKPCNPGEHKLAPDHPDTDKQFKDRANELARCDEESTKFEGKAARHNESGILRREGALKRENKGQAKSAVSGTTQEEEVGLRCTVCGVRVDGELDHVTQDKDGSVNAVECKTGAFPGLDQAQIDRNTRQMERLRNLSENGTNVIYKVEEGTPEGPIRDLAEQVGLEIKDIITVP